MRAKLEYRYDRCGFVYAGTTRMMFTPRHTVTRKEEDKESTDLVLCACTGRWSEPSKPELTAMRHAVIQAFPDASLYCDTTEGLVQVYVPPVAPTAAATAGATLPVT